MELNLTPINCRELIEKSGLPPNEKSESIIDLVEPDYQLCPDVDELTIGRLGSEDVKLYVRVRPGKEELVDWNDTKLYSMELSQYFDPRDYL